MRDARHFPRYTLYIRRCDKTMRLIEQRTQEIVAIRRLVDMPNDMDRGILVQLMDKNRVSVYLMRHEVQVVDELPEVEGKRNVVLDVAV